MIKALRNQKNVQRLNGKYVLRSYNLMEHQYMVAVLFIEVCKWEGIKIDPLWVELILKHDIVETITTDLPWDVKHINEDTEKYWADIEQLAINKFNKNLEDYTDNNNMQNLMPDYVFKLFQFCDMLDLWMFCKEEVMLGNNSDCIKEVIHNCEKSMLGKYESIDKIVSEF